MIMSSEDSAGRERRRHERVHKMIDMHFGMLEDLSDFVVDKQGTLLDIGGGGLRFLSDELVDIATQLMVILEFPGWQENADDWAFFPESNDIGVLKVVGMVVRCLPSSLQPGRYEVAICFCGRVKKE